MAKCLDYREPGRRDGVFQVGGRLRDTLFFSEKYINISPTTLKILSLRKVPNTSHIPMIELLNGLDVLGVELLFFHLSSWKTGNELPKTLQEEGKLGGNVRLLLY
ncbi:hypothetical protein NPIL_232581 [Nephila pilipes]|uniref:Uncharacterized protein n=1 Tax=Nephila pilipes TaxID=299642 RepID=A0A8X6NRS7_NEPPI|nr:hypothetical protein NPIL_232581 [Nephila pilipes]